MKRVKFLCLVISFCLIGSFVFAETIVLKSGKKIEGTIIERTDKYIAIDFYGMPVTYYFEDVENINGETLAIVNKDKIREDEFISEAIEILIEEGKQYGDKGRFDDAILSFKKAISLNPHNAKSHMLLGLTYLQLGQTDDAIESLQKSLELNPKDYEVYSPLSAAYQEKGKMQKAIDCYIKFIEVCPISLLKAQTYTLLGNLYSTTGEYEKSKNAMDEAIAIFKEQGDDSTAKAIEMMKREIP